MTHWATQQLPCRDYLIFMLFFFLLLLLILFFFFWVGRVARAEGEVRGQGDEWDQDAWC